MLLLLLTIFPHLCESSIKAGIFVLFLLVPQYLGQFQVQKHPAAKRVKFALSGIQSKSTQPTLGEGKGWPPSHPHTP